MNTYKAIRNEISSDNMMATVHQLAKWKRHSGTAEELEAFKYLKSVLDGFGYTTRLIPCETYISLPVSCTLKVNDEPVYAQTHSMVPNAHALAPLIYCQNETEIRNTNCANKIVLTNGRAVYGPVKAAQDGNAAGIIFVQEAVIRECIPSACWGSPTTHDWGLLPKIPVASIIDDAGNPMIEQLKSGSTLIADITTEVDTGWRNIPLLIGDIKAPENCNQFVQLTGHCDSWYYGAIDNGTSNSLQVEIARIAKEHQAELKRNFRVVFYSGHSHGRYAGSAWYADNFFEDLRANCIANINTDSAGCRGADDIIHSIVMPEAKPLAVQIVKEQTGEQFEGKRCGRLGDQSFWNVGLSSAFASFSRQKKRMLPNGKMGFERGNSELGPGWHTPDDLEKHIDPNNLLRDAKIVGEYVMTCLTEQVIPMHLECAVAKITSELEKWAALAGDKFDLDDTIERSKQLNGKVELFMDTELSESVKNECILKLSRLLTAINFTRGSIYGNEPALPIDAIPVLSPIHKLIDQNTAEVDIPALKLELLRARNFINHNIKLANDLLDSVMK